MDKKDAFREFIRSKPYLVTKVKNKETSWQELYEIYDLYGEDENAWNKFKDEDRAAPLSELASLVKNINMDNVQKYINNAQKAINVIQELTNKPTTNTNIVTPKNSNLDIFKTPLYLSFSLSSILISILTDLSPSLRRL